MYAKRKLSILPFAKYCRNSILFCRCIDTSAEGGVLSNEIHKMKTIKINKKQTTAMSFSLFLLIKPFDD